MKDVFEKRGDPAVLSAEAEGLAAIAATGTIRVPRVIDLDAQRGVLLLEHLAFASPHAGFGERFGRALAALHRHPCGELYGWPGDNFIGATPQVNTRSANWLAFWRDARLAPMLARLRADPALSAAVGEVIDRMASLFEDGYVPSPSLIHGDLWSGNWGMLADGTPVIFDPCVSYSDHEAELAMMELFGAMPPGFRRGYGDKLHGGYPRRRPLYQLYHLLNHAVLFGGGYGRQALACAREVLARMRAASG